MGVGNLTGTYHVRALLSAFHDAHKWFPRKRHRAILRRHALKLRYWPDHHPTSDSGLVLDLDYSVIQSLKGEKIFELRIHESIGDCDNIRVIFWVAPLRHDQAMPNIWVLAVLQKKRDDFTSAQIDIFLGRKALAIARFYEA